MYKLLINNVKYYNTFKVDFTMSYISCDKTIIKQINEKKLLPVLFSASLNVQLSKSTPMHPSRLIPVAAVTPSGQHPNTDNWHESNGCSEVDVTEIKSSVVTEIII